MRTFPKNFLTLLFAVPAVLAALPAQAVVQQALAPSSTLSYTFDFENILRPLSTTDVTLRGYGIGNIGLSPGISLGMTTALQTVAATATVTATGAVATQNYNGEGRVPTTLGNSEGGVPVKLTMDTFLVNNNFRAVETNRTTAKAGSVVDPDRFSLSFANFTVTGVEFDYEIFPDAQCQRNSGCGPDMSLLAGTSKVWGMATTPSTTVDPQALGRTQKIAFSGVDKLTFVDWPSEIGIDNLTITGCVTAVAGKCAPSAVSEPGAIALFGLGLFGLAAMRRHPRRG